MRRKILKVGMSSLAVSLPKDFVKLNNLQTGQEVEVSLHGSMLNLRTEDSAAVIEKEIDLTDITTKKDLERLMNRILGAIFRQGTDKLTIKLKDKEKVDVVRKILMNGRLNLYEEPSNSVKNEIIIHSSISNYNKSALENLIKVVIKEIYKNFDDFLELLNKEELTKEKARVIVERDSVVNDHCDVCKRIINKEVTDYKSTEKYTYVDRLEKIGDQVKNLVRYAGENPNEVEQNKELLEAIKQLFHQLFMANNNMSVKKINDFFQENHSIQEQITKCKSPTIYYCCRRITSNIIDAYSNLIAEGM